MLIEVPANSSVHWQDQAFWIVVHDARGHSPVLLGERIDTDLPHRNVQWRRVIPGFHYRPNVPF